MTETSVSLYKESLISIDTFLKSIGMPTSPQISEGLVTTVNLISDYREEGTSLTPDILLINTAAFFQTLPYQHHIALGNEEIHEKSFPMAIKMCAPLSDNGWIMYLLLRDESHFEYGIVNAITPTIILLNADDFQSLHHFLSMLSTNTLFRHALEWIPTPTKSLCLTT